MGPKRAIAIAIVILGVLTGCGTSAPSSPSPQATPAPKTEAAPKPPPEHPARAVASALFERQSKGLPSDDLWIAGKAQARLYTVTTFEVLSDMRPLDAFPAQAEELRDKVDLAKSKFASDGLDSLVEAQRLLNEGRLVAQRHALNPGRVVYGNTTVSPDEAVAKMEAVEAEMIEHVGGVIERTAMRQGALAALAGDDARVVKMRARSTTKGGQEILKTWSVLVTAEAEGWKVAGLYDDAEPPSTDDLMVHVGDAVPVYDGIPEVPTPAVPPMLTVEEEGELREAYTARLDAEAEQGRRDAEAAAKTRAEEQAAIAAAIATGRQYRWMRDGRGAATVTITGPGQARVAVEGVGEKALLVEAPAGGRPAIRFWTGVIGAGVAGAKDYRVSTEGDYALKCRIEGTTLVTDKGERLERIR